MVAERSWQELHRFEDADLARAVATCIAAMEYEVRLHGRHGWHVVEVEAGHWRDLAGVLEEIIIEQQEFDQLLEARRTAGRPGRLVAIVGVSGLVELLLLLAATDW